MNKENIEQYYYQKVTIYTTSGKYTGFLARALNGIILIMRGFSSHHSEELKFFTFDEILEVQIDD